jgi:hypothetical protein
MANIDQAKAGGNMRSSVIAAVVAGGIVLGAIAPAARAAPVRDEILSQVSHFGTSACHVLKIEFNVPTRYISHYPLERGTELRIDVRALLISRDPARFARRREALAPPKQSRTVLAAIEYDGSTLPGPTLNLAFRESVAFRVAQGDDFRSVIVAIARPRGSGVCEPIFPAR